MIRSRYVASRLQHGTEAFDAQSIDGGKDSAEIAEHVIAAAAAEKGIRANRAGMSQALHIGRLDEGPGIRAWQIAAERAGQIDIFHPRMSDLKLQAELLGEGLRGEGFVRISGRRGKVDERRDLCSHHHSATKY